MSLRFITDENLSPRLAALLSVFDRDNAITACVDHFDRGTPDEVWLREIGTWTDPKPVVLAGDYRILRRPAELVALKTANVSFVYLAPPWLNIPWETQAWKILKAWPSVVQEVSRTRQPSVFEVTINLKVQNKGAISSLPN